MSDEATNGNKTIACREVTLGKYALETAAEVYARKRYPDCEHLVSMLDDGFGGKIMLFTKGEVSETETAAPPGKDG